MLYSHAAINSVVQLKGVNLLALPSPPALSRLGCGCSALLVRDSASVLSLEHRGREERDQVRTSDPEGVGDLRGEKGAVAAGEEAAVGAHLAVLV